MISPVSAPQRGQRPSSTRSGRSFSLSSAAICSTVAPREVGDVVDEVVAVALAVLDVGEALLPVAGQLGRGERVLLEHRDHLEALRRRRRGPCRRARCTRGGSASRSSRRAWPGCRGRAPSSPRAAPRRRSACRRSPSRRAASPRCSAAAAASPSPRLSASTHLTLWPCSSGGSSALSSGPPRPAASRPRRPRARRRRASPASSVILPRVRKRSSSTSVTIVVRA